MRSFGLALLALALCLSGSFGCGEAPKPDVPRPLADRDGDGIANQQLGGRDCNDNDVTIPGGLEEKRGNKIDDNCNGQIDEFWLKTGYWRLTTAGQADAKWDINIAVHESTALQHISCLQFKFKLISTVDKRTYHITQWQTGLPYTAITIKDNAFKWELNQPNRSLKIFLDGRVTGEQSISGTITIEDTDPKVNAKATLTFVGKPVTKLSNDAAEKEFCGRCYADATCAKR